MKTIVATVPLDIIYFTFLRYSITFFSAMTRVVNAGEVSLVQWRRTLQRPHSALREVTCGKYTFGMNTGLSYIWRNLWGRSYLKRDGITTEADRGQSKICQGKDTMEKYTYGITEGESQLLLEHLAQYKGWSTGHAREYLVRWGQEMTEFRNALIERHL